MKTFCLSTIFLSFFLLNINSLFAQNTFIPDDNFEQALIDLGYDSGMLNDSVPSLNIKPVTSLNVNEKNISDLTGIKDFTSLTVLNCGNNKLTVLNTSNNLSLLELLCFNNQINTIDLSTNTNLTGLVCYNNNLTEIELSAAPALITLNCSNNQLSSLDLSKNISLKYVNCSNNELHSLNLKNGNNNNMTGGNYWETGTDSRNNPDLFCIQVDNVENATSYYTWYEDFWSEYNVDCSTFDVVMVYVPDDNFEQALINLGYDSGSLNDSVPITSIKYVKNLNISSRNITNLTGIEHFTSLKKLYCSNNKISSLNLSNNTNLIFLDCSNNLLTQLDLHNNTILQTLYCSYNKLIDLDLSSNSNLSSIICNQNELTSLNVRNGNNSNMQLDTRYNPELFCIQVDDASASYNWYKNAYTAYSENCSGYVAEMTYIPDDKFEQALVDLGLDAGVLNDSVPTVAAKNLKGLNVSYKNINDLTGIEDFIAMEQLNCYNNQISEIDLTTLTNLKTLQIYNNKLSDLDLSSNPFLTSLNAGSNQLSGLNLRNGNNANMSVNVQNNPDLLCIQVDDEDATYTYSNWYKNAYTGYSEDCSNYVMEMTYVPDDNFEQALIDLELDFGELNDSVFKCAVQYLKFLDIEHKNIYNLTGIEDFYKLEEFWCKANNLSSLDLSSNKNLKKLNCSFNKLEELKIISQQLIYLDLSYNSILSIDLSKHINIETLSCSYNKLTKLDLKNNLLLSTLYCDNNYLKNLDFSNNVNILNLRVTSNSLTYLDISSNPNLAYLDCRNNELTWLNLKNDYNEKLLHMYADNNSYLCIQVDDTIAVKNYNLWNKDDWANYSEDCSKHEIEMTYVPDDNFESTMIKQKYDTGILNDSIPTVILKSLTYLNLSENNISDLTGIEDCINLTTLFCDNNQLSVIDLKSNRKLQNLKCSNNLLKTIDISFNTELSIFFCSDNQISKLDVGSNPKIQRMNCFSNYITTLDLTSNTKLEILYCHNNKLKSLNISDKPSFFYLSCQNNELTQLRIKNLNNKLLQIDTRNNPDLMCIEVDNVDAAYKNKKLFKDEQASYSENCGFSEEMTYIPDDNFEQALIDLGYDSGELDDSVLTTSIQKITSLDVNDNNISSMQGIEDFINLSSIYCHNNKITQLNLNNNKKLTTVGCSYNQISVLSVDSLVNLVRFECAINLLTNVNISNNPHLSYFDCSNNQLTYIDATSNLDLTNLICPNNRLTELDLHLNSKLVELHCGDNQLLSLDLSNNFELQTLYCYRNNLSELNIKNGNNSKMTGNGHEMKAHNNPNLTCIKVDDSILAMGYSDWFKDPWTRYSEDCLTDGRGITQSEYNSLLDLYYSTLGEDWTINTNWADVTKTVDNWYGVTVIDGHVTHIMLNNNNLQNTAFEKMIYLPKLKWLDLGNNKLTGFNFQGTDSLESLDIFIINNNQLIFEDLIPAFSTSNYSNFSKQFNYSPQAKIGTTENIIKMAGENFSVEISEKFLSPNDQFHWYKEYSPLEGETNSGIDFFPVSTSDSGSYYLQITNPYVPNLTLYSELIHIGVTDSLVDSLLLFSLTQKYAQLQTIWDYNDPFSTWPGVTFENGKVTTLDLSGLQLEGDFSSFFTDFDSLKWLDLSNNKLSGEFPKIGAINKSPIKSNGSNNQNLKYLDISNNNFIFAELEPAFDFFQTIDTFIYAPQSMVGLPFDTTIYKNQPLTFKIANYTSGSFDSYFWSKDGTEITDANEFAFAIKNAAPGDSGYYTCTITNLLFPELTLLSDTSRLNVLIPVGIDDFNDTHFNIYPNPVEKQIFVETGNKTVNLKIFDIVGKLFFEKESFITGWINIEPFTSGIYFVRITSQNSETITKKVIFK